MDMDSFLVMHFLVLILAFGEEILKASLVFISKGTYFIIAAIIFLPVMEAILYYSDMHQHALELGIQENLAFPYTLFVIIGAKLFHVATSIFYYYSENIFTYIIFGTLIHFIHNTIIENLPTLSPLNYAIVPWIMSLSYGLIMYVFHNFMRRYPT